MPSKRGTRSKDSYLRRKERDLVRNILLWFCWRDTINKDCVYTDWFIEKCVRPKLKAAFVGEEPTYAYDHENGEVLNRFPLRVFPQNSYMMKGGFQK